VPISLGGRWVAAYRIGDAFVGAGLRGKPRLSLGISVLLRYRADPRIGRHRNWSDSLAPGS
jgi:hypothetical protein